MPDPINLAKLRALLQAKVKPCPLCGALPRLDEPLAFQETDGPKWGALICCGQGPEVRTGYKEVSHWRGEALEAWNDRWMDNVTLRLLEVARAAKAFRSCYIGIGDHSFVTQPGMTIDVLREKWTALCRALEGIELGEGE